MENDHRNVPTAVGLFRLGIGSGLGSDNDATASSGTRSENGIGPGNGSLAESLHCKGVFIFQINIF